VRVGEVCVKTDRGARVKRKPEQVCPSRLPPCTLEALKLVLVDPASKKQACGVIAAVLDFLYRVSG
jgi:hypothetical protein